MANTISGFLVRGLCDALVARGADEQRLRQAAGFPAGLRLTRVPHTVFDDLIELGLDETGDPLLGLHLCGAVGLDQGGVVGLLMLACPNVRTALQRAFRAQRLMTDFQRLGLLEDDRGAWVEVRVPDRSRPAGRHAVDWILGDARILLERLTGGYHPPERVELQHAAPVDASEYEAWFGCPVVFGAERDRVRLSATVLDLPVRSASTVFRAIFERQVDDALSSLPLAEQGTVQVAEVVRAALPEVPTLAEVAEILRRAPRTLQRELAEEGTSLSKVVDDVRSDLAQEQLLEGREVGEIAWLLGYSEPRAFARAFRRWTGASPTEWRDAPDR